MERYNKNIKIGSTEYNHLINLEIDSWSKAANPDNYKDISYEEFKQFQTEKTFHKGIIDEEVKHIIKLSNKSVSILELGSGSSWFRKALLLQDNIKEIYEVDIINKEVQTKVESGKIIITLPLDLNQIDKIKALIHKDKRFDCIVIHGTLHHLVYPDKVLEYCSKILLKENGLLIITDNYKKDKTTIKINALLFNTFLLFPLSLFKIISPNSKRIPESKKDYSLIRNILDFWRILFNTRCAEHILYSYDTSPFESISGYEDYENFLNKNYKCIHFEERGSLAIFQTIGDAYPNPIKWIFNKIGLGVNWIDKLFIKLGILHGTIYLGVYENQKV